MLRELLLSVASGIIVALVMQVFRGGGRRNTGMSQTMSSVNYRQPRREGGGFGAGLIRLVLAVGGGLALAYSIAPFILPRRFRDFDGGGHGRDRFDGFDGFDGFDAITANAPMLILTVLGTIIIWMLLSALSRR